jgi:hypothetical protein
MKLKNVQQEQQKNQKKALLKVHLLNKYQILLIKKQRRIQNHLQLFHQVQYKIKSS